MMIELIPYLMCLVVAVAMVVYPLRRYKLTALILASVVIILALVGYLVWGAWPQWQQHIKQQIQQKRVDAVLSQLSGPDDLIKRLKTRLDIKPNDAKGWYLLGRLYASQQRWPKSYQSFKKAFALNPNDEKITLNFVQAQLQINGQLNEKSLELINKLLLVNPNQLDALSMLAMNAFAKHDYQEAINYWQKVLSKLDKRSKEAKAIRKAITEGEKRLMITKF